MIKREVSCIYPEKNKSEAKLLSLNQRKKLFHTSFKEPLWLGLIAGSVIFFLPDLQRIFISKVHHR